MFGNSDTDEDNIKAEEQRLARRTSVLNDWVENLSMMQQSVLLSAIRNSDGVEKFHPSKMLLKWYRRCVLRSAFDGRTLTTPDEEGGGSFTGPVYSLGVAADDFVTARDGMSLHYYAHAMHAFEILGYKHPDLPTRAFWYSTYVRMAHALHLYPENERQMDLRLGDNIAGWEARNDSAATCSD